MIPVSGNLKELTLCHQRRFGQQISSALFDVFHPSLKRLNDAGALGKDNGQSLTDQIHRCEIFKLSADLVVVALSGFFLLRKERIHFILCGICNTVNTL